MNIKILVEAMSSKELADSTYRALCMKYPDEKLYPLSEILAKVDSMTRGEREELVARYMRGFSGAEALTEIGTLYFRKQKGKKITFIIAGLTFEQATRAVQPAKDICFVWNSMESAKQILFSKI